ncbi:hypothetical protein BKA66DRAFT_309640 [Pyrenochaeta sp. MPI-SDFR-AT-0127]|nr:hypothetical protein BKA66DRAFT_309640 [Pyrenochaeta sp. MPI-SDFR-AT-0127]
MTSLSWEAHERLQCERFLQKIQNSVDPTWGFYVYGTYTRPQGQGDVDKDSDEDKTQEVAGET